MYSFRYMLNGTHMYASHDEGKNATSTTFDNNMEPGAL